MRFEVLIWCPDRTSMRRDSSIKPEVEDRIPTEAASHQVVVIEVADGAHH